MTNLHNFTPEELGANGVPILEDLGFLSPESWLGDLTTLGKEIRAVLMTPSGEIKPPLAAVATLLEQTCPITRDPSSMAVVLCRVGAVMVFLNKAGATPQ